MNQAPLGLPRHGIEVLVPEEMAHLEILDVVDVARPLTLVHLLEYLNGAHVLQAAPHQQLLFVPLGLECHARNLAVKRDGDDGGHQEDQEQGIARFLALSHWVRSPAERIVRASIGYLSTLPRPRTSRASTRSSPAKSSTTASACTSWTRTSWPRMPYGTSARRSPPWRRKAWISPAGPST